MSSSLARLKFVEEIHRLAPTLKPYVEACLADRLHQQQVERQKREEEERLRLEELMKEEERKKQEEEKKQQEQTK